MMLTDLVARASEAVLPAALLERLRGRREWARWAGRLERRHFQAPGEDDGKRELFRASVKLVEIETHARCNRICPFCPNVLADRRQNRARADSRMLDRVFDELGSIGYAGQIKVARYSEPLADVDHLLERIASARRRVPVAELAVVTNTDYLTAALLPRLRDAGLDVLYLSLYLRTREIWSPDLAVTYTRRLATRLGTPVKRMRVTEVGVRAELEYPGLMLRSACMDFGSYGTDRGGAIEKYTTERRRGPCREPFETFVIDYDGSVQPCCNIRHDLKEHAALAVAKLTAEGPSIFDVYASRLTAWRRSMVGLGPKDAPCTTCRHRDVPAELLGDVRRVVTRRLKRLGVPELVDGG